MTFGLGGFQAFENELQRDGRDGFALREGTRLEASFLQAFEIKTKAAGIPMEDLDLVAGLDEEAKQGA